MKKLVVILVTILSFLPNGVRAEQPILPVIGRDYTILEVSKFASEKTLLSHNWRKEIVEIVNNGFKEADKTDFVLSEDDIEFILSKTTYEKRTLINFQNSGKTKENEIRYFPNTIYEGDVAVFRYEGLTLVIFKPSCVNPVKVAPEIKAKEEVKKAPVVVTSPPPPIVKIDNGWGKKETEIITYRRVPQEQAKVKNKVNIFPWLAIGIPTLGAIVWGIVALNNRDNSSSSNGGSNPPASSGGTPGGAATDVGTPGGAGTSNFHF